jgi:hypothetical protein
MGFWVGLILAAFSSHSLLFNYSNSIYDMVMIGFATSFLSYVINNFLGDEK